MCRQNEVAAAGFQVGLRLLESATCDVGRVEAHCLKAL
jgi:hypothetical protein